MYVYAAKNPGNILQLDVRSVCIALLPLNFQALSVLLRGGRDPVHTEYMPCLVKLKVPSGLGNFEYWIFFQW